MYTQKRSKRRSPNHNDAGDGPLGRLGVRSFALEHLHKAIMLKGRPFLGEVEAAGHQKLEAHVLGALQYFAA
jgi:hypothetical protein